MKLKEISELQKSIDVPRSRLKTMSKILTYDLLSQNHLFDDKYDDKTCKTLKIIWKLSRLLILGQCSDQCHDVEIITMMPWCNGYHICTTSFD